MITCLPKLPVQRRGFCAVAFLLFATLAASAQTNILSATTNTVNLTDSLPNVGASLGRVMLALAVVLGIFLGGVWLFRNWQRLTIHRGQTPKLNVLEARSLGGRHALYIVGYERERFLLAASPAGVNLLSHLPPAEEPAAGTTTAAAPASFVQALTDKLKGK